MIDTNRYKAALEAELAVVSKELTTLGIHNPDITQDWIATPDNTGTAEADPNVAADKAEDLGEREAIVADLETRYNNLVRALQKITDGTYGVCEISGEPIESDRLDANPAARTCQAHMDNENQLPK